jgi:serine/threonine protein kinase
MPEKEILCMTKGITYALRHLQMLGVSHGDLRTKNIYFDVDYFLFRVYDNELINGPFSLFRKSLE